MSTANDILIRAAANPMSDPSSVTREALLSLQEKECPGCGGPKGSRKSHCRKCYFSLDAEARKALYLRIGSGYERALLESIQFIRGGGVT